MLVCRHCGFESAEGLRFCGSCGAQLQQVSTERQTRKVVTALLCDVTGSTALGEELDPEVLRSTPTPGMKWSTTLVVGSIGMRWTADHVVPFVEVTV